jgi:hypothetical protein
MRRAVLREPGHAEQRHEEPVGRVVGETVGIVARPGVDDRQA